MEAPKTSRAGEERPAAPRYRRSVTAADIRPATAADIDRIVDVWWSAYHDGHAGLVPEELLAHRTRDAFVPRVEAALDRTRVAVVDGVIAGITITKGDEVEQVFLDAAYRGTGIASQMLADAAQQVIAAGHPVPWLAVVTDNARAHRFYEREGWVDMGEEPYAAPTGPDSHVMISVHRMELRQGA